MKMTDEGDDESLFPTASAVPINSDSADGGLTLEPGNVTKGQDIG